MQYCKGGTKNIISLCLYTRPIICIALTTLMIINYYVVVCVTSAQAEASMFPRRRGAAPAPADIRGSDFCIRQSPQHPQTG